MAKRQRASQKQKKRERREAARHGLTLDADRNRPVTRYRKRRNTEQQHEQWTANSRDDRD